MRFFQFEGQLYTVVNPSDRESLPGIPNSDPEFNLCGRELRHAIWLTERNPELAYMLTRYDAESAFLARLSIDPKNVPLVRSGNGYALDPKVQESWGRLEQLLLYVSNVLLRATNKRPEAKFPFDAFWHEPLEYGYRNIHPHDVAARRAIGKSLDALRALLARTSLSIALTDPDANVSPPLWVSVLIHERVPDAYIDLLRQSVVAEFSPGMRVGAYINPSLHGNGTRWVDHLPTMFRAKVPTYIAWPPQPAIPAIIRRYPFLQPMLPVIQEVVVVPHNADGTWKPFFRWSSLRGPGSAAPRDLVQQPLSPPHGHRQLPGESFYAFVARREAQHRKDEATETPTARAARQEREARASSFAKPTPASRTTVYLWMTVGEKEGHCTVDEWLELEYRELIGRQRLVEIWPMYSNRQKRYDAWHNEWDIYPPLAMDDTHPGDYDDEEESVYDEPGQSLQLASPTPRPTVTSAQPHEDKEKEEEHRRLQLFQVELRLQYNHDNTDFVAFTPPLAEVVRKRYGLVAIYAPDLRLSWDEYDAAALRKITGYTVTDLPDNSSFVKPLSAFVKSFDDNPNKPAANTYLWDLDPSNRESLLGISYEHPFIRLRRVVLNGSDWYHISYKTEDDQIAWWYLVVKSATTVVEMMRRYDITTTRQAVDFLVTRGMPFHTLVRPDRHHSGRMLPDLHIVLGWRHKNNLNRYDYMTYEERARTVLRGPRVRAALQRGGIVWRLTMELLRETGDVGTALGVRLGPSEVVNDYGTVFRPRRGDDYLDDKLSPDELDVICGVYKVTISTFDC